MKKYRTESEFRKDVITWLQSKGFLANACTDSRYSMGDKGLPDITAIHYTGLVLFLELKIRNNKPSPAQCKWLSYAPNSYLVYPSVWESVQKQILHLLL